MEIDEATLWRLSYYRVSELTGALLVGRLARRTADPEISVYFTEQCAEEAKHAWLWTEAITALGATPVLIRETHQSMYTRIAGAPRTMLDILACTKVFEERVYDFLGRELEAVDLHPIIRSTIETILADEAEHVEGADILLKKMSLEHGPGVVAARIDYYRDVDQKAFDLVISNYAAPWDMLTRPAVSPVPRRDSFDSAPPSPVRT